MAGGAFVPLEPEHPGARLGAIAADADLDQVLVGEDLVEVARAAFAAKFPIHELSVAGARKDAPRPQRSRPDDAAYLLYTSGSTGDPKGVLHTNLDHAYDMRTYANALRFAPSDRVLLAARPAFRA